MKTSKFEIAEKKITGALTGAEIIAIEQAERYKTDLAIMENGQIIHISPEEMRRRLAIK